MPMQLDGLAGRLGYQAIVEDRARLDIKGEGEDDGLSIVYRPRQATANTCVDLTARLRDMKVTMDAVSDSEKVDELASMSAQVAQALADMVIEWDIYETPTEVMSHSYERLLRVDFITLCALFSAIMNDSSGQMSKPAGTPSPAPTHGGSSARARITNSKASASRKR